MLLLFYCVYVREGSSTRFFRDSHFQSKLTNLMYLVMIRIDSHLVSMLQYFIAPVIHYYVIVYDYITLIDYSRT